ncbi:MAG: NfeD family protein [Rikenellaceae bacterium]|nr:NfeD family protein [Rikenellaceae bacterium]
MWYIIILIIVGVLLLVAELVLLPGLSIAGICALISFLGAVYIAFTSYGPTGGAIAIAAVLCLSLIATFFSLRAKTWRRLALDNQVKGTSQPLPQEKISEGASGRTITRLAPLGNIDIDGQTYEARSVGDLYVNPNTEVEVVGFENFTVLVKVTGCEPPKC